MERTVAADADILLFGAVQVPGPRKLRTYTLHCPDHEATTTMSLERDNRDGDAEVLGAMIEALRRAALVDGKVCKHTPKGWRR